LLAHWLADIAQDVPIDKKYVFVDALIASIAISGENTP